MIYDEKPWLKFYDEGIPPEFPTPDCSLIERFAETAAKVPDKPAIHFLGVTLTYRELTAKANSFAQALIAQGFGPGDVVGLNMPNLPQ